MANTEAVAVAAYIAPVAAAVVAPEEALALQAIAWATNLSDHAALKGLASALPATVLEEQTRLYQGRSSGLVAQPSNEVRRIVVHPQL